MLSDAPSTPTPVPPPQIPAGFPDAVASELHRSWGWLLGLGVLQVIVGMLAVGSSFIATMATVIAFGVMLLLGGGVQLVGSFFCRKWSGFFLELLVGVLYVIVGMLMINQPAEMAAGLTLMIAAFLLVGGIFRVAASLSVRFEGWGWMLLSGAVTTMLGVLIWRQWPVSGLWVIGLFVGIEFIFHGWTWIMLGLTVKQLKPN